MKFIEKGITQGLRFTPSKKMNAEFRRVSVFRLPIGALLCATSPAPRSPSRQATASPASENSGKCSAEMNCESRPMVSRTAGANMCSDRKSKPKKN